MIVFLKLEMLFDHQCKLVIGSAKQSYMLPQESYRNSFGVSARDICVFIYQILILLHVDDDDDEDDGDDDDLYDYSTAL